MLSSKLLSREYLPIVLGVRAHGNLGEKIRKIRKTTFWQIHVSGSTDTRYNPTVDPSVLNEFATVAFRSLLLESKKTILFAN